MPVSRRDWAPHQVIVYNLTQRDASGAPKLVRALTYEPATLDPPPPGSALRREWDAFFGASAHPAATALSGRPSERASQRPDTPGAAELAALASIPVAFDGPLRPFASCCFSADGRQLLAVSAAPEARAVCWHWATNVVAFSNNGLLLDRHDAPTAQASDSESGCGGAPPSEPALLATGSASDSAGGRGAAAGGHGRGSVARGALAASVARVRFHPTDPSLVSTSGPSHVRLWRVSPQPQETASSAAPAAGHGSSGGPAPRSAAAAAAALGLGPPKLCLLPLPPVRRLPPRDDAERYSDHAWLADGRLVVSSDAGHLVVVGCHAQWRLRGFSITRRPSCRSLLRPCFCCIPLKSFSLYSKSHHQPPPSPISSFFLLIFFQIQGGG